MKITVIEKKEVEVKYLQVDAGVRYWEDSILNGKPDVDGDMPCREEGKWQPLINLETGMVENWVIGYTADLHYKVCDEGKYALLDANKNEVKRIDGYVPDIMCPHGGGYGDYIIMHIDEVGYIGSFRPLLDEFEE